MPGSTSRSVKNTRDFALLRQTSRASVRRFLSQVCALAHRGRPRPTLQPVGRAPTLGPALRGAGSERSPMRRRLVGELALCLCFFVAGARAASGQTTVALNYDPLLHELTENSALGAHGDIARAFGSIAAVGEVGANHFNQATVITLAPGIRYAIGATTSRIRPAVQAVVGLW